MAINRRKTSPFAVAEEISMKVSVVMTWLCVLTILSKTTRNIAQSFIETLGGHGEWSGSKLALFAASFLILAVVFHLASGEE